MRVRNTVPWTSASVTVQPGRERTFMRERWGIYFTTKVTFLFNLTETSAAPPQTKADSTKPRW